MNSIKIISLAILCTMLTKTSYAQVVYQHVDNYPIYEFLDEMANMQFIDINSAVKPYSRTYIADKLMEINQSIADLSPRQKGELEFFIKEYQKEIRNGKDLDYFGKNYFGNNRLPVSKRSKRFDLFYYRDSTFMLSLNPILGGQVYVNDSGNVYHRWNGAEMMFYAKERIGVYANLRDNYLSKSIAAPEYLTHQTGGGFKNPTYGFSNQQAVEYSEMRGGITGNGKWWSLGIIKDHNVWGNNYNGANIFSNRSPSYAQLRLNMKPVSWFELNYFHGWLSSKVIDSTATQDYGTGTTNVYVPKFIAANFVTIKPVKHLHVSIGNSIVYSRSINAGYMIPLMFYKSLDHTYSTLGNSQMFIDVSVRNLKKCHFYFTGYFDDFSFGRLFEKYNVTPWSFKVGGRMSNIFENVSVTAEYTRNNVFAYEHFNPETTFENTKYNLGNYLRDNAQEVFLMLTWKPVARLWVDLMYNMASKGPDYEDNRNETDPNTGEPIIYTYSFQESIEWEKSAFALQAKYELVNDLIVRVKFEYADVRDDNNIYTPAQFQGKQLTSSAMITFGF